MIVGEPHAYSVPPQLSAEDQPGRAQRDEADAQVVDGGPATALTFGMVALASTITTSADAGG